MRKGSFKHQKASQAIREAERLVRMAQSCAKCLLFQMNECQGDDGSYENCPPKEVNRDSQTHALQARAGVRG